MKNNFTTEQLLDPTLKNIGGESNLEVRKRMLEFFEYIINEYEDKRIAVVSHGAAIKFLLQYFCEYDYKSECFLFGNKVVCSSFRRVDEIMLRYIFWGSIRVKFE